MKLSRLIGISILLLLFLLSIPNSLDGCNPNGEVIQIKQTDNRGTVAYTPHAPISITSDADFETQSWPGNGTLINPYVISGLNISSTGICIEISDTRAYFTITNCIFTSPTMGNFYGLHLDNVTNGAVRNCITDSHTTGFLIRDSEDCILTNNTADGTYGEGFVFFTSSKITITNNTAKDCPNVGFHFSASGNCTLTNNTAINSHKGFNLYNTANCILINNTAKGTSFWGFDIDTNARNTTLIKNTALDSTNGFAIYVENCTLINNTAIGNSNAGIILIHADNCTIIGNIIRGNDLGLELHSSSNAILYFNMMYSNDINAEDADGVNNQWDDNVSSGNSWDDYSGSGVYNVPGTAGSVDRYPFLLDFVLPTIDSPVNTSYGEGTTDNVITWTPADAHPVSYIVYRNGANGLTNPWDGSQIVVNVDGLTLGIYNYTIEVLDFGGNSVTDEVFVTVLDETSPIVDYPADILYNESSTGYSITWHASDLHPQGYSIYIDEISVRTGTWNSSSEIFMISVDGHEVGTYNYTLELIDIGGNTATSEVTVTVVDDTTSPLIDVPLDIEYEESSTGYSITWNPSDLHPVSYTIYLEGNLVNSGEWNSSSESITISVDGLTVGTYNYTLVVTDIGGNIATDSVIVTVIEAATIPTTLPDGMTIVTIAISVGVIVIIIIVLKKRGT